MDTCTPLVCFSCKQEPTTRKGFWHHHFLFDWKKETRRERVPSAPLAFKEKQETRGVEDPSRPGHFYSLSETSQDDTPDSCNH